MATTCTTLYALPAITRNIFMETTCTTLYALPASHGTSSWKQRVLPCTLCLRHTEHLHGNNVYYPVRSACVTCIGELVQAVPLLATLF
ncbi:hypothetical protein ACOMHN_052802 [Nucella lapillus]